MMQATKDWPGDRLHVWWQPVPVGLQRYRQGRRRLRDAWSQRHVWAPGVVVRYPVIQKATEVVSRQGNHEVHALSPQRADEPLTERVGLRRLRRR